MIVFLTVCTHQRKPLLARPEAVAALLAGWERAQAWTVGRYVIMPDHLHLFCAPAEAPARPLAKWVQFWKALVSKTWPWPVEQLIWQLDCWDTQLRPGEHYGQRWEYVRQNPVRAGLVTRTEDWPFQGTLHELRW